MAKFNRTKKLIKQMPYDELIEEHKELIKHIPKDDPEYKEQKEELSEYKEERAEKEGYFKGSLVVGTQGGGFFRGGAVGKNTQPNYGGLVGGMTRGYADGGEINPNPELTRDDSETSQDSRIGYDPVKVAEHFAGINPDRYTSSVTGSSWRDILPIAHAAEDIDKSIEYGTGNQVRRAALQAMTGQAPEEVTGKDVAKTFMGKSDPEQSQRFKDIGMENPIEDIAGQGVQLGTNYQSLFPALASIKNFRGLHVRPYMADETLATPAYTTKIGAPNKALAEYKALDVPAFRGKEYADLPPVVTGIDRGDYTELVDQYSPINKRWAWGKDKLKKAQEETKMNDFVNSIKKSIPHAETDAQDFHQAVTTAQESSPMHKQNITTYTPEEYSQMKTYLSPDGKSGYAIKPDGELVSVFSTEKGRGNDIVSHAVQNGATKLDAFDINGKLPDLYRSHGFETYKVDKNWTPGGPDVHYMAIPEKHPEFFQKKISNTKINNLSDVIDNPNINVGMEHTPEYMEPENKWKESGYNYRLNSLEDPYVAIKDNKVIGHLGMTPEGQIDAVYTNPEYRGQGIAEQLFEHAANENGLVKGEISSSEPEILKLWEKLKNKYPNEITKQNGYYIWDKR